MIEPSAKEGTAAPAVAEGSAPRTLSLNHLVRVVRTCGGDLLMQAALYVQLLRVEWAVERARLQSLVMVTLAGFAFLLGLLGAASMLWLAFFWDTRFRVPAAATLVAAYAVGLAWAWLRGQALLRLGEQSFSAMRQELAADFELLGREE